MKSKEFLIDSKAPIIWGKLNIVNQNLIVDRAKTQSDGIYKFRGIMYRVNDHRATHFATVNGELLMGAGHFNVLVGNFEGGMGWETKAKKLLRVIK